MDQLFEIFEKRTFNDLRTLVNETNQPTLYLKSILDEICIYNKRGPYKGMYELKPQYKNRTTTVMQMDPLANQNLTFL